MVGSIQGGAYAQYQSTQNIQASNGFANDAAIKQQEQQTQSLKTQDKNSTGFHGSSLREQANAEKETSAPPVQQSASAAAGLRGSTLDISV